MLAASGAMGSLTKEDAMNREDRAGIWVGAWALVTAGLVVTAASTLRAANEPKPGDETSPRAERESGGADAERRAGEAESADAAVLSQMHQANQVEIQAGDLAKQKAASEDVRKFGDQLAKDHRQSDEEVLSIARKHNIPLAKADADAATPGAASANAAQATLSREHRATLDKLRDAQGAEFDREFIKAMSEGHQKSINKLQEAKDDVSNPDVVQLVNKTLPKLQEHHQKVQRLRPAQPAG
jgi:putative membrane protein